MSKESEIPDRTSMRDSMPWLYPASTAHIDDLVRRGIVAIDANILLGLYRLLPPARSEMLSALKTLEERLFIPHQAAIEFHHGRLGAMKALHAELQGANSRASELRKAVLALVEDLATRFRAAPARIVSARNQFQASFDALDELLRGLDQERDIDPEKHASGDHVLESVDSLTVGKVGRPLATSGEDIEAEARERFEQQRPPGYKDAQKNNGNAMGDYLLWLQLIEEVRSRNLPVVLISDDQKDDWVWRDQGQRLGARRELVKEMWEKTGQSFVLLTGTQFLQAARRALPTQVSDETLVQTTDSSWMWRSHLVRNMDWLQAPDHNILKMRYPDLSPFFGLGHIHEDALLDRLSELKRRIADAEAQMSELKALEGEIEDATLDQRKSDLLEQIRYMGVTRDTIKRLLELSHPGEGGTESTAPEKDEPQAPEDGPMDDES